MTDDEDYITLLPTDDPRYFMVVEMKYRKGQDDYVQGRYSLRLKAVAAEALAKSWAAAMKLEIR